MMRLLFTFILIIGCVFFAGGQPQTSINSNQKAKSWLSGSKSNVKEVDNFLKSLSGKMRLLTLKYRESTLIDIKTLKRGRKGGEDNTWSNRVGTSLVNGDAFDLNITFKLEEGVANSSGVGVAFDFTDWSNENYLMIPASVYNGNRIKIVNRGYAKGLDRKYLYQKDIPLMSNPIPQLSPESVSLSKIEVNASNVTTPAICFFDRKRKRAFIMLAEQKNGERDNGLIVQESTDRKTASLIVTAPGVREKRPLFIGFDDKSPDRGMDMKEGDEIKMKLRIYNFDASDIPALLEKFMAVRKAVTGKNNPRNFLPMSEVAKLMTGRIDSRFYDGKYKFYCPENAEWISFGWIGGLMNTYPMLALGDGFHLDRVVKTFDFAIPRAQGQSGYFYGAIDKEGMPFGREGYNEFPEIVLTRKNADVLYWMIKQFELLKSQKRDYIIKSEWENNIKRLADAFVTTWKDHGEWGRMVNNHTGQVAEYNTTGGAMAIGGLVLAAKYFQNPEYLDIAKKAAEFYFQRDLVQQGKTTGGCADILQNADSETAVAFMTSLITLFEATGDKYWFEKATVLANLSSTWVVSYDYELPPETQLAKLGANLAGAIWASTQNKHSAPGSCTSSADSFFKIYRATRDLRYADIMRDIIHAHAEGVQPNGMITERLGYCDAGSSRGSRGNHTTGWCELNGFLMALEIPGIYLRTDKDELYVFDHVEVTEIKRDADEISIKINNKTDFDASVTILAEDEEKMKKPLGINAFINWPAVNIKAGRTMKILFNSKGELIKTYYF